MTRVWALAGIVPLLVGCGSSGSDVSDGAVDAPLSGDAGPPPADAALPDSDGPLFGAMATLTRYTSMGTPTTLADVVVPLVGRRAGVLYLNVGVDLNGDGQIAAYGNDGAMQEEWVARDLPLAAVPASDAVSFLTVDPAVTAGRSVAVKASLGAAPIGDTLTDAPAGAELFRHATSVVTAEAQFPADPAPDYIGAGALGTSTVFAGAQAQTATAEVSGHIKEDPANGVVMPTRGQLYVDCFAHAISNALVWLARRNGAGMLGTTDVSNTMSIQDHTQLVEDVINVFKGMNAYSDTNGATPDRMLAGKQAVVAQYMLPVKTTLVGNPTANPQIFDGAGTWDALQKAINADCAVEGVFGIRATGDDGRGGTKEYQKAQHMVDITGFAQGKGKASITLRDSNRASTLASPTEAGTDRVFDVQLRDGQGPVINGGFRFKYYDMKDINHAMPLYDDFKAELQMILVECWMPGSSVAPGDGGAGDAPATGAPLPTATPLHAVFNQASFSTTYVSTISNPAMTAMTITWDGPNCGTFTPMTPMTSSATSVPVTMTWYHPHPPCAPNTNHADSTIKLHIVTAAGETVCNYVGAETGDGAACVSTKK